MTPEELRERTRQFALACIRISRSAAVDEASKVMAKQLVRCGTSVGANYRAACLAKSTADMVNKLKIVEEEVDEAKYWLSLLVDSGSLSPDAVSPLSQEADELFRITVASVRTLRNRQS